MDMGCNLPPRAFLQLWHIYPLNPNWTRLSYTFHLFAGQWFSLSSHCRHPFLSAGAPPP